MWGNRRPAVSVTGFETLPRDKRTEAIRLLNWERGRFGYTGIAVILWVNRATLAEMATWSADFYSWRSATFILEPPPGWNTLDSARRGYLQALVSQNEFVNLQGLAPTRGGQIVQMRMDDIFIPLRAEQEVKLSEVIFSFGSEGPVALEITEDAEGALAARVKTETHRARLVGKTALVVEGKTGSQSVSLSFLEERERRRAQREGDRVLKALLHDPRWTEIILLTAGHLGESSQYRATRFVQTILAARSEYENILHRDLLMAARCLADDIRVDTQVRRASVTKLCKLYCDFTLPGALREDIGQVFVRLGRTTVEKDVLAVLLKRLTDSEQYVRGAAARALGQLEAAAETPEVLAALLKRLTDSDEGVRRTAAGALGQMGATAATPEVLAALLKYLTDSEEYVRRAAAGALRNLSAYVHSQERPEVMKLFLPLTRSRTADSRETGYVGLRNLLAGDYAEAAQV